MGIEEKLDVRALFRIARFSPRADAAASDEYHDTFAHFSFITCG